MSTSTMMVKGVVGNTPTLNVNKNGIEVANFVLYENRKNGYSFKYKVVVWGNPATWCRYNLEKGSKVIVLDGYLQWNDNLGKDGKPRHDLELVALDLVKQARSKGRECNENESDKTNEVSEARNSALEED